MPTSKRTLPTGRVAYHHQPQINPNKVGAKDPTADRTYDSTGTPILGPQGQEVSNPSEQRHQLLEDLMVMLQSTAWDQLSGHPFMVNVDRVGNHLHELVTYAASLKDACDSVRESYPVPDTDATEDVLDTINDLCDVLIEGVNRVNGYLGAVRTFGNDLDSIRDEIYNQAVVLDQEL